MTTVLVFWLAQMSWQGWNLLIVLTGLYHQQQHQRILYQDHWQHHTHPLSSSSACPRCWRVELDGMASTLVLLLQASVAGIQYGHVPCCPVIIAISWLRLLFRILRSAATAVLLDSNTGVPCWRCLPQSSYSIFSGWCHCWPVETLPDVDLLWSSFLGCSAGTRSFL